MIPATDRSFYEATSWRRRHRWPTKRGRRFIHNVVVLQMSDRAAAIDAGYSTSTAENTREKIWSQPSVRAHFEALVQKVLPPDRVTRIYDQLLAGKCVRTQLTKERIAGADGTISLQVVSETRTETISRAVQLRALELAIEHGGLGPSSIRAPAITGAPLAEVLERARLEHTKNGELMTPDWRKERVKGLTAIGNGNGNKVDAAAVAMAESAAAPANSCDSRGQTRCAHARCPVCEMCETCDNPA
jgi:hypothetical protein